MFLPILDEGTKFPIFGASWPKLKLLGPVFEGLDFSRAKL
jgi:hypothetical protein